MAKLGFVSKVVERVDNWINSITGLGVEGVDKNTGARARWKPRTEFEMDHLYSGSTTAQRVCDVLPNEALRENWKHLNLTPAQDTAIKLRNGQIGVRENLEDAWGQARRYGGSLIMMVTKGTKSMVEPMTDDEEVVSLVTLSRWEVWVEGTDLDVDLTSDNFGYAKFYRLMLSTMGAGFNLKDGKPLLSEPVHYSRFVRFDGAKLPRRLYIANNYWHDSVLNRMESVIRNYETNHDSASTTMADYNVGVWKIKNLAALISAGKTDDLKDRVHMANYGKSVIKSIIIDADGEDYQDKARTTTGMPELLDRSGQRLVAGTDMPHTKLLGESPTGSNSTGNSTTVMWYDHVGSAQRNFLLPRMMKLYKAVHKGLPANFEIQFAKLFQLDDVQAATARYTQSQTDALYIQNQVLSPDEVAISRFGGGDYSAATQIDVTSRVLEGPEEEEDPDPAVDPKDKTKDPAKDPKEA